MSNLVDHARRELESYGAFDEEKDFYGGMTGEAVLELVEVFAKQGHSGMSASIVRQLFNTVADWKPLGPLTGDDDEWNEGAFGVFQNNRCSRVFKENDVAYDMDGVIFRNPDGGCFTSNDSRVDVTFPYIPKSEYVDVEPDDD